MPLVQLVIYESSQQEWKELKDGKAIGEDRFFLYTVHILCYFHGAFIPLKSKGATSFMEHIKRTSGILVTDSGNYTDF